MKREDEWKYLVAYYRTQRCSVCNIGGCDPAHIKSRGSGANIEDDNIIGLCRRHHTEQHTIGWSKMCDRYPVIRIILQMKGWEFNEYGKLVKS